MIVRPIKRFVLLLDEQDETVEGGVIVMRPRGSPYLDYLVVAVGRDEKVDFGPGDRAVLKDPNAGRRVRIDGVIYRLVRVSDIIAVVGE